MLCRMSMEESKVFSSDVEIREVVSTHAKIECQKNSFKEYIL